MFLFFSLEVFLFERERERGVQTEINNLFVVILVVTLLLNVVFNNSTIYGPKNELECVIVLAVASEAGGH